MDHGIVPREFTSLGVDRRFWLILIFPGYIGIGKRNGKKIRQMRVLRIFCARRQCHLSDRPLIGGNELGHGHTFGFVGGVAGHRNFTGFRAGFLVRGGLQQFDRPIVKRSAAIIRDRMYQTCRSEPGVTVLQRNLRRLRALLRIRDLGVAQRNAEIITAVVVHQRRLSGIDRDSKGADEHVFKYKVMAGFSGDFHGRLCLLRPGSQSENDEQSHEQKFSHRAAILALARQNANGNIRAKGERRNQAASVVFQK